MLLVIHETMVREARALAASRVVQSKFEGEHPQEYRELIAEDLDGFFLDQEEEDPELQVDLDAQYQEYLARISGRAAGS